MSDEINEITEEHSDYKPADARDESVKHQLTGMYQNWFLDYASYVILERAYWDQFCFCFCAVQRTV